MGTTKSNRSRVRVLVALRPDELERVRAVRTATSIDSAAASTSSVLRALILRGLESIDAELANVRKAA